MSSRNQNKREQFPMHFMRLVLSQTRKDWTETEKSLTHIAQELRSKNPQQNISEVNPATYKTIIHVTLICKGGLTFEK